MGVFPTIGGVCGLYIVVIIYEEGGGIRPVGSDLAIDDGESVRLHDSSRDTDCTHHLDQEVSALSYT